MNEMYVKFRQVEDIVHFVSAASKCSYPVDVSCGRFGADGKSLMGVMAIGLDKKVRVRMQTEESDQLRNELKPYEM